MQASVTAIQNGVQRFVHIAAHLTSFHLNRAHCNWSQPQQTGSL